jgi:hypothetical protein
MLHCRPKRLHVTYKKLTLAQSVYAVTATLYALATQNMTSSFLSDYSIASTDDWWPTFRECGGIFKILNSTGWKFDIHKLEHYAVSKHQAQITQLLGTVRDVS